MKKNIQRQLIMLSKRLLYGFIIQLFFCGVLIANDSNAQRKTIDNVNVKIALKDQPVKAAFDLIESTTDFRFTYNDNMIDFNQPVTIEKSNQSVYKVLEEISKQTRMSFVQVNDNIHVNAGKNPDKKNTIEIKEFYQIEIKGRVVDQKGEPLPGVTIVVEGTTIGTVTNIDGYYSLEVPEGGILVFSFIGFESRRESVTNQSEINIVLKEDAKSLEEVVVVGFGTQNRRDVTGSITSINQSEIRELAVSSPEAMLQGKAPGVQIVQNSGTPGGEVFVRIRGTASLLGESRPLYVIDGVPLNTSTAVSSGGERLSPLADINPNDIESMEILKDAAATAIYGSRGSNGVILITTKRGKTGQAKVSFDFYRGVQNVWRTQDLLNGSQFVDVLTEALNNRNPNLINNPPFNTIEVTGTNTNYQDEIFRAATIENYALSVSGGNDKVTTFLSAGFFNQQGTIIGQDFKRYSLRYNVDYQATDKLKVGSSTTLSNAIQNRVETGFGSRSILANAIIRNPNLPVFNPDGSYSVDPLGVENPVMLANEVTFNGTQRRIVSNIYAEYGIAEGLSFRTVFGVDYNDDRQNLYVPSIVVGTQGNAQATAFMLDEQTIINDNTLTYTKTFADKHNLSLLAGFGTQRSTLNFLSAGGQGAGSDIITTIGAVGSPNIPNQNITGWGLLSYFGRVNYSFQSKYLVEGSIRVDGSSRFGENKRYGTFPGISLGWRLSEEGFLNSSQTISDLKLRFGVGVTGNQDGIGNFASKALYSPGANYDGNPGIAQQNIPNADLGWESTQTTNLGVDLAILNGRFSLMADAYIKTTKDLLFPFQLPWTSGFSSIGLANIGTMENRGLEAAISANILKGEFKWVANFNISFNRVKITDLPVNGSAGSDFIFKLPDSNGIEGPYQIYRIGQPLGSFIGYVFDGVYETDESVPAALFNRGLRGGDARFIDLNEDGVFDRTNDRTIIGNALPQHIGGFTNNFSYKGFSLNLLFNWSYGNDIYNMTRAVLTSMSEEFNQSVEVLDRWQQQGDVTQIPRALYASSSVAGNAPTDASSRFLEDGSFLRLRNATFAYSLPNSFLEKWKVSSARIYFSGQNLWTLTNYTGFDPENQNLGTGTPILGVDYLNQPQPRTYMVGVNLSF
jgi:TonB-dependent starch-binding outer membrane protein SusC